MLTKLDIEKYFVAEKSESLIFLIIGIVAIAVSIFFFLSLKTNFYKGAAIPLLIVGLIQVVVGYTVYARSDEQRISNVYSYDMDPGKLKSEELPRMKAVNKRFIQYRWIEIALLIIGIILILSHRIEIAKNYWAGFGITLALQAAIMLGTDYFAEKRADVYARKLESFIAGMKPFQ
ncbi:MAG TPA: hypothetical protein VFV08_10545 [Puia sp.]|nr:hypothetical protein [Puia sp.]